MDEYLLGNVRFYFAQSVFMQSCHYQAYDSLKKKEKITSRYVKIFSIATIILLTLNIVGLKLGWELFLDVLSFLGLALTCSSLVFGFICNSNLSMLIYYHKTTAENYKTLRDKYMTLISDVMSDSFDREILVIRRNSLQEKYSEIGCNSPFTSFENYKAAQKSLGLNGEGEAFSWSDEEIDRFLPDKLKLNRENKK